MVDRRNRDLIVDESIRRWVTCRDVTAEAPGRTEEDPSIIFDLFVSNSSVNRLHTTTVNQSKLNYSLALAAGIQ
jgi:hypothetical protein